MRRIALGTFMYAVVTALYAVAETLDRVWP